MARVLAVGKVDLEKLRSINSLNRTRGKTRLRELHSDQDGSRTGFQIDHHDGRVEAIVRPQPVTQSVSLSTGEVVSNG